MITVTITPAQVDGDGVYIGQTFSWDSSQYGTTMVSWVIHQSIKKIIFSKRFYGRSFLCDHDADVIFEQPVLIEDFIMVNGNVIAEDEFRSSMISVDGDLICDYLILQPSSDDDVMVPSMNVVGDLISKSGISIEETYYDGDGPEPDPVVVSFSGRVLVGYLSSDENTVIYVHNVLCKTGTDDAGSSIGNLVMFPESKLMIRGDLCAEQIFGTGTIYHTDSITTIDGISSTVSLVDLEAEDLVSHMRAVAASMAVSNDSRLPEIEEE